MSRRWYIAVEGEGETKAALNLVTRLWKDLGLPTGIPWAQQPYRKHALSQPRHVEELCERLRRKDCSHLLVLHDLDDGCPKEEGPRLASWFRDAQLPFPVATVFLRREYE